MRKRDIERFLTGDVRDTESLYELSDEVDAPVRARMRGYRDGEPGPRARGRLTEEARARLAQEREAVAAGPGAATPTATCPPTTCLSTRGSWC